MVFSVDVWIGRVANGLIVQPYGAASGSVDDRGYGQRPRFDVRVIGQCINVHCFIFRRGNGIGLRARRVVDGLDGYQQTGRSLTHSVARRVVHRICTREIRRRHVENALVARDFCAAAGHAVDGDHGQVSPVDLHIVDQHVDPDGRILLRFALVVHGYDVVVYGCDLDHNSAGGLFIAVGQGVGKLVPTEEVGHWSVGYQIIAPSRRPMSGLGKRYNGRRLAATQRDVVSHDGNGDGDFLRRGDRIPLCHQLPGDVEDDDFNRGLGAHRSVAHLVVKCISAAEKGVRRIAHLTADAGQLYASVGRVGHNAHHRQRILIDIAVVAQQIVLNGRILLRLYTVVIGNGRIVDRGNLHAHGRAGRALSVGYFVLKLVGAKGIFRRRVAHIAADHCDAALRRRRQFGNGEIARFDVAVVGQNIDIDNLVFVRLDFVVVGHRHIVDRGNPYQHRCGVFERSAVDDVIKGHIAEKVGRRRIAQTAATELFNGALVGRANRLDGRCR